MRRSLLRKVPRRKANHKKRPGLERRGKQLGLAHSAADATGLRASIVLQYSFSTIDGHTQVHERAYSCLNARKKRLRCAWRLFMRKAFPPAPLVCHGRGILNSNS